MKRVKPSGFQFTNPKTKKILFQINENFDKSKYEGLPVSYDVEVSNIKDASAIATLQIMVGQENDETPFYINLSICTEFRWTDDVTDELLEKLLKQNAIMLLMSYARPTIAHLTADAGFKPFNIPFVNLKDETGDD